VTHHDALAGFLRIVTPPRVYRRPTPLETAVGFVDGLVEQPTCIAAAAGARHWTILRELLADAEARGNLVPDAHLAAIAIEHGATVATRDRGCALPPRSLARSAERAQDPRPLSRPHTRPDPAISPVPARSRAPTVTATTTEAAKETT
jgi:predicted nucleic acid-binding protein